MHWIDGHAHLSFFNDSVIQQMITSAESKNLRHWILAGFESKDWHRQLELHSQFKGSLTPVLGLHPWPVISMAPEQITAALKTLETLLPQAKAMGETGVDKFRGGESELVKKQLDVFERHLELNKTYNLPLVLHIVRAENETLDVLKNYSYTGVLHGFSASYETAKRYIDLGYKISVGRGVFAKGYKQLKESVEKLSLDDLILESDAGLNEDGTPEDPVALYFQVVDAVAELKGLPREELLSTNFSNVKKVFRL